MSQRNIVPMPVQTKWLLGKEVGFTEMDIRPKEKRQKTNSKWRNYVERCENDSDIEISLK